MSYIDEEKKDPTSTSKDVSAPITPHFKVKRDDGKRSEVFEVKLNEPKSNNAFIRSILNLSKDPSGNSKTSPKDKSNQNKPNL
jgi:hypothetical protein